MTWLCSLAALLLSYMTYMIVEAEGNSYKLFLLQAILFYYRQFQILIIIIIISSILLHGSMVDSYHTNMAQNSQQITQSKKMTSLCQEKK